MTTVYEVGQQLELRGTFYDEDSNLVDPSTISLVITLPDGTTVSKVKADLTAESTGVYTYAYTITMDGAHRYKYSSTGPVSAKEGYFPVKPVQVPTKYL